MLYISTTISCFIGNNKLLTVKYMTKLGKI